MKKDTEKERIGLRRKDTDERKDTEKGYRYEGRKNETKKGNIHEIIEKIESRRIKEASRRWSRDSPM